MTKDNDCDFEPKTIVEAYLQQEILRLREALEIECSGSYNVEKALQPTQADEIEVLKHCIENRAKQWAEQHIQIKSQADEIKQLQADNEKLREALEVCKYDCNTGEVIVIAKEALSTTQPESQPESVVLDNRTTQKPLSDEALLKLLKSIDQSTERLPIGFKLFARAIEEAHGIE